MFKNEVLYRGQSYRLISLLIHQNTLRYCAGLSRDSCKAREEMILHDTHFSQTIPLSIKHHFISVQKSHTCTLFPFLSLSSNLIASLSRLVCSQSVLFVVFSFSLSALLFHATSVNFFLQLNFQLTLLAQYANLQQCYHSK